MKDSLVPLPRSLLAPLLALCLSACGSGNDGPKAIMGQGGVYREQTDAELKRIPLNAALLDGSFSVLSDLDIKESTGASELPFPRDKVTEVSSSPAQDRNYITFSDSELNLGTNLVFRAIRQVPPKESILKVKKFQLKLSGLNLYKPAGLKDDLLHGQILCFLDGKACVAASAAGDATEKEGFLKRATSLSGEWLNAAVLRGEIDIAGGAKLVSASGVVVVDFLKILKGNDAAIVDFIYQHSQEYSEQESGHRKFRFAVGDRVYLSSGSLELEFETDPNKLPADFWKRPAIPKHGVSDQVYSLDQVKADSSASTLADPATD